jgi:hypothetical protein
MRNAELRVENGEWGMGNGERGMGNGEWEYNFLFRIPHSPFPSPSSC